MGYAPEFNPRFQGFDQYVGFVSGNVDYHAHIDQEGYLDWWQDTTINNEEADIDGISIKQLLLKGAEMPERDLFWEYGRQRAIHSGSWKLVSIAAKEGERIELFNLSTDISEENNLAEQKPELVNQLQQKLAAWKEDVNSGLTSVSK